MLVINLNNQWYRTENLESINKYLKKNFKPLRNYIDLDSQKLVKILIEFLNSPEKLKTVNYYSHQLKIEKIIKDQETKLYFKVYLKIPSAKKKMEIDSFMANLIVLQTENLKELI